LTINMRSGVGSVGFAAGYHGKSVWVSATEHAGVNAPE
jgi:hypothetical protein